MCRKLLSDAVKRCSFFTLFVLLVMASSQTVNAESVELNITGYWSEADFKVTDKTDRSYNPNSPKHDGTVFGVAPSGGNAAVKLLVNTDGMMFFAKGTQFTNAAGVYILDHDFYGYNDVSLVGGMFDFGSAVWNSSGILSRLEGPGEVRAALWTDVDITQANPTRLSFRMFGKAKGLNADIFVGGVTNRGGQLGMVLGTDFLLCEYYAGEEIRSRKITADAKVLR